MILLKRMFFIVIIDFMNISRINLNLIVVLHVLLETCNTTRAAEQLFLTQSSISSALKQLRELFNDPLFVRQSKGLSPTPRALALKPDVDTVIQQINHLFSNKEFDPAHDETIFTIAMSDFCEAILLQRLQHHLSEYAPFCKLIIKPVGTLDFLNGPTPLEADAYLGVFTRLPCHYESEIILSDKAVCLADKNHPLMKKRGELTAKNYFSAKHIAVYYGEDPLQNTIDALLQKQGQQREVSTFAPHALAAAHALMSSDYLLTVPQSLAGALSQTLPLKSKPLDFFTVEGALHQVWHTRFSQDPANVWLRSLIKDLLKKGPKPL